jgi:FkbM family methyltransferase
MNDPQRSPRSSRYPRSPQWLQELLPLRVHREGSEADRPPEIVALDEAQQAQQRGGAPSSGYSQDDPFAIHELRRAERRRTRERIRAGRTPRDRARINIGLGRRAPSNEEYDAQTIEVMRRVLRPESNCVDVGCHQGTMLREIVRLAPEGRHFGFEPLPHLYRELCNTFVDHPRCEFFEMALADARGESNFHHVTTNPGYSGLRQRHYDRPDERIEIIRVHQERLDDILPADLAIHLIKIDVEGAEFGVLRGAERTLVAHRPYVIFEYGLGGADFYGSEANDVFDFLSGTCGLRINTMQRWLHDEREFSLEEFEEHFKGGLNYYFMAHRPQS